MMYVLCSSAPFQTQSVIFTTLLHHLGVPGSSPCGSHWDVLALQEPGSLSIPTRLPWAPCLAPEPLSCATLCTVNMTHGTRSDPGREEHGVTSSPSGLLRALHPPTRPEWGFRDRFLSSFFQGLSRARIFCVQHGQQKFQDFPCIFYGSA